MSQAWYEGYNAFEAWAECPYDVGSKEYSDWNWGYSCAETDDEGYRMFNGED